MAVESCSQVGETMIIPHNIEPAQIQDKKQIEKFLQNNLRAHRHLDWLELDEWIGQSGFFLLKHKDQITAILCATPDIENVAWIHLFACVTDFDYSRAWRILFRHFCVCLSKTAPQTRIHSIALTPWFDQLLIKSKFSQTEAICVLEKNLHFDQEQNRSSSFPGEIHRMTFEQIPQVLEVDHNAFAPLWQLSERALEKALQAADYATVLCRNGKIIAYQLCTATYLQAHLARLAVHSGERGQGIGQILIEDVFDYYTKERIWSLSVNTQQSNQASIALYLKTGFVAVDESFPVYTYSLKSSKL